MRKLFLLATIFLVMASIALPVQTNADNGVTNILQIVHITQLTPVTEQMSQEDAIGEMKLRANSIVYKADEPNDDGMKYPAQVLKDHNGDCEDFTLFVLSRLRTYGFALKDLGFIHIKFRDLPIAHLMPIYLDGDNWRMIDHWLKISLDDPIHVNWTLDSYFWYIGLIPAMTIEEVIIVKGLTADSEVEIQGPEPEITTTMAFTRLMWKLQWDMILDFAYRYWPFKNP